MPTSNANGGGFGPVAEATAPRIAFRPHHALPWLLLPEGKPLQVLVDSTTVRVPNTRRWFLGVASQRGNLLPVFDMASWAGLPDEVDTHPQIISIGLGTQACAILCTTTPTLLKVSSEERTSVGDGVLSPFLGRSYTSAQGGARDFDIQRWLATVAQQISGNTTT